jgi:hypothetical protein
VDSTADRARVPEQPARNALEAKDPVRRGKGENRSGGYGRVERGKPRRRGRATYDIQTLHYFTTEISYHQKLNEKKNLGGFGPLAKYADRATADCWRSSANFCG